MANMAGDEVLLNCTVATGNDPSEDDIIWTRDGKTMNLNDTSSEFVGLQMSSPCLPAQKPSSHLIALYSIQTVPSRKLVIQLLDTTALLHHECRRCRTAPLAVQTQTAQLWVS